MKKIKRISEFRNLGMGIFLHFGLYNQLGKGEWYQKMYQLTSKEYYQLFGDLKEVTVKLNFEQIARVAKESGFQYLVLTIKHHDGFCLFDSQGVSVYDISQTQNKDNLLEEFIQVCYKNNLKPFLYFATLDWSWDDAEISFVEQLTKINQEIELLCKNYPQIAGFWFDGNWSRKKVDWEVEKLYQIIRYYLPEAIIINNSGLANAGKEQDQEVDVLTYEQGHLSSINYQNLKRDLAAEASQSFNDHWGIASEDYHYKSLTELILKFVACRREKANYLLNLSLTKEGNLLPLEQETVKVFGQWIKKYGFMFFEDYEIIGQHGSDFILKTQNGEHYVFLYDLASGGHVKAIQKGGKIQARRSFTLFEPLKKIQEMSYLDSQEQINFVQKEEELIIIPSAFNYGFNTVVRVIKICFK